MDILENIEKELTDEYNITKNFLDLFPKDKNEYAPHVKSMKLMPLANHIVDIFGWPSLILNTEFLDFASGYHPKITAGKEDLKTHLDKHFKKGLRVLQEATPEDLDPLWSIRNNGEKIMEWSKYGAIRHALNQLTHHRAQLGVYYRLLNIHVPGSYGPSADTGSK